VYSNIEIHNVFCDSLLIFCYEEPQVVVVVASHDLAGLFKEAILARIALIERSQSFTLECVGGRAVDTSDLPKKIFDAFATIACDLSKDNGF
jgi:hypothetical protein